MKYKFIVLFLPDTFTVFFAHCLVCNVLFCTFMFNSFSDPSFCANVWNIYIVLMFRLKRFNANSFSCGCCFTYMSFKSVTWTCIVVLYVEYYMYLLL